MERTELSGVCACVTTMSSVETMQKPKMPEHVHHYAANRHGFLHVDDVPIDCEVLTDGQRRESCKQYVREFYMRNSHTVLHCSGAVLTLLHAKKIKVPKKYN